MKNKADLVSGLLRKADSDLVAMTASAQAGALDAACFHAQQAAEKYLKAYLADSEKEITRTHNLFKLIDRCAEIDPAFTELVDAAEVLTPFAVQARYDTEFWPSEAVYEEAQAVTNRISCANRNRGRERLKPSASIRTRRCCPFLIVISLL